MNIFCFCGTLQSVSYRTRFKDWMCEDCFQKRLKELKKKWEWRYMPVGKCYKYVLK